MRRTLIAIAAAALAILAIALPIAFRRSSSQANAALGSDQAVFSAYAGSQSCRDCHTNAYAAWRQSHHARAERPVAAQDRAAFDPPRMVRHGSQSTEIKADEVRLLLVTLGRDGKRALFPVDRVIGEAPLRQFLVRDGGGREQVAELAYDPGKRDWFDVFGNDDRKPGEWGHWTGRGMTWNQMCASCHNTRLRKHYDTSNDTYGTTMAEAAVGCEACLADGDTREMATRTPTAGQG